MQSSSPLRGSPVYVLVIFVAMFTLYMVLHEKSFRVIYSEGNVDDLLQPQGAQTIRDKLASLVEPVRIRLLRSGQRAAGNENGVGVASVRVTLIPKEQSEKGVTDAPLEQDVPPIDDGKRKENNNMFQGNEANYEKQANTVQQQRAAGEAQQEEEQPTVDKAEPEEPNEDAKQKEEQQKAAVDEKQKEEQQKATVEKLKEEQQKAIQEAKQNEEPKKATEEAKQKEAQTKAAEEAQKKEERMKEVEEAKQKEQQQKEEQEAKQKEQQQNGDEKADKKRAAEQRNQVEAPPARLADEIEREQCEIRKNRPDRFTFPISGGNDFTECSSCAPPQRPPRKHMILWRKLFDSDGRATVVRKSNIATIVCPGPSVEQLSPQKRKFISEKTDAWGLNDVSRIKDIKFRFLHMEPGNVEGARVTYHGHPFVYDEWQHGSATVVCEQSCHGFQRSLANVTLGSREFCDYVTYKRECITDDCKAMVGANEPPYAYRSKDFPGKVRVAMGNSLNRVLDISCKLGYEQILFAGCDGTPNHVGDAKAHGTTVNGKFIHPSQAYGYKVWGILFEEFVIKFMAHNAYPCLSLTPKPFNQEVPETRASFGNDLVEVYKFS